MDLNLLQRIVPLIPLFPLAGWILIGIFGRRMGHKSVGALATALVFASFAVGVFTFITAMKAPGELPARLIYFDWVAAGGLVVPIGFQIDQLSLLMVGVVSGVGALIHLYSTGYMKGDPGYPRFFSYLNLFTFFMLVLVLAENYLLMFVGWEGVGLCSYLLIGFWYTNSAPTQAGKKAFIVNRIGDAGFIIGLMLLVTSPLAVPEHGTTEGLRTLSYQPLFDNVIHLIESDPATFTATLAPLVTIITICLFFGATGKSAQLPLYTWLPDAMEGPTPVSALIHAATMVTAGVYMVARSHVLFAISPTTMAIIAIVGAVTAIFAATIALVQTDIKRVLAYSTISQLGYMFVGCGTGAFFAGIFHLMTHAFFKACLFLGAGSVIIGCHHEQDMRKMGGLRKFMPITAWTFLVATLAIAGAPGLAGFFSKDTILHEAFTLPFAAGSAGQFAGIVGYITALLTAGYMFRLYLRTFEGPYLGDEHHKPHETLPSMTGVLVVLAILSVLGGWVGFSTNYQQATPIQAYLNPVFHHGVEAAAHYLEVEEVKSPPYVYMLVSIIAFALGLFLMYTYIRQNPEIQRNLKLRYHAVYKMLWEKYRVDELYANLFTKPGTWLCGVLWKNVDEHVIDDGLVEGTGRATEWLGQAIRPMQTGFLRSYALYIVIGVAILILLASV